MLCFSRAKSSSSSLLFSSGLAILLGCSDLYIRPALGQSVEDSTPLLPEVSGWLMVKRLQGNVLYHSQESRKARLGDRLHEIGSSISTARKSAAKLVLDSNIGSIQVAENSCIRVQNLTTQPDGARVTVLDVPTGQVRLQVRKFSNPNSRLELHTPHGVAAVRGTEFGITNDQHARTTIGTLSGNVEFKTEGKSVFVEPGFSSAIFPDDQPLETYPLDRELKFQTLEYRRQGNNVLLVLKVNPANSVFINGESISPSREGEVRRELYYSDKTFINVVVENPLGERRHQKLWRYHQ